MSTRSSPTTTPRWTIGWTSACRSLPGHLLDRIGQEVSGQLWHVKPTAIVVDRTCAPDPLQPHGSVVSCRSLVKSATLENLLNPSTPSRTALATSLMRAVHSRNDPMPLLSDTWGDRLVPESAQAALRQRAMGRI